jgi:uncharacterized membrane protein (DUF373 family)
MNLIESSGVSREGRLDAIVVASLRHFNSFIHTMLAIALAAASIMVVWDFIVDVIDEIHSSTLGVGFLRALGTLFLLWTMSALITAEIGYIRTGRFNLRVFIEVAMITLLRQLIIRPMQLAVGDTSMGWMDMAQFGLVLCGLLTIGIVHRLVGQAVPDASVPNSREGNVSSVSR